MKAIYFDVQEKLCFSHMCAHEQLSSICLSGQGSYKKLGPRYWHAFIPNMVPAFGEIYSQSNQSRLMAGAC